MNRKIIGVTVGTTLNPKKIAGNAEHSHSWNDLTDKPFGETEGLEITWDGNTEGLEYVVIEGGLTEEMFRAFYLVSDETVSNDNLLGMTYTREEVITVGEPSDPETLTGCIDEQTLQDWINGGWITDDFVLGEDYVIARKDNCDVEGIVFPKKGIYFQYVNQNSSDLDAYSYTSKLLIPGSIKQLDEKFIPDTICRKEYVDQLLGASIEEIASLIGGDA